MSAVAVASTPRRRRWFERSQAATLAVAPDELDAVRRGIWSRLMLAVDCHDVEEQRMLRALGREVLRAPAGTIRLAPGLLSLVCAEIVRLRGAGSDDAWRRADLMSSVVDRAVAALEAQRSGA